MRRGGGGGAPGGGLGGGGEPGGGGLRVKSVCAPVAMRIALRVPTKPYPTHGGPETPDPTSSARTTTSLACSTPSR